MKCYKDIEIRSQDYISWLEASSREIVKNKGKVDTRGKKSLHENLKSNYAVHRVLLKHLYESAWICIYAENGGEAVKETEFMEQRMSVRMTLG